MICWTPPPGAAGAGAGTGTGAGAEVIVLCWTLRAGGGAGGGRLEAELTGLCLTGRFVVFVVAPLEALEGFVVIGSSTGGPGLRGGGGGSAVT